MNGTAAPWLWERDRGRHFIGPGHEAELHGGRGFQAPIVGLGILRARFTARIRRKASRSMVASRLLRGAVLALCFAFLAVPSCRTRHAVRESSPEMLYKKAHQSLN